MLREGSAQVAGGLDRAAIRVLARDPLLSAVPSGGDQGSGSSARSGVSLRESRPRR